jgi:hypothetical protein
MFEKRRMSRGVTGQLHLGSERTANETHKKTLALEIAKRIVGTFIRQRRNE